MTTVQVKLPPKLIPVFAPARGKLRYRGARGGRGSGKSFNFAKMAAVWGIIEPLRFLCTRDLQNSIKESFHAELKNAINSEPWLQAAYDVGIDYLRGFNGTEFLFRGLRHGMSGIKSTAQIDVCIVEEAEDVPESSWIDLEPTIRAPKSEIWVLWNPRAEDSPVDKRFVKNTPPRSMIVEMNYTDNPWFPDVLEEQRRHQLETFDPDTYAHIWEGAYLARSEAQVFGGHWEVRDFEPGEDWNGPYQGLDFGFAQDPTAAVRCWEHEGYLYIEHEAGKVGLELDDTGKFVCDRIPGFHRFEVIADSARPESISHLKRVHHERVALPRIKGAKKGKGSVEDGITHMRSFKKIIVHTRCVETQKEMRLYSYKVDKLTKQVLADVVDKFNHYMDAIRYALEPLMLARQTQGIMVPRRYKR